MEEVVMGDVFTQHTLSTFIRHTHKKNLFLLVWLPPGYGVSGYQVVQVVSIPVSCLRVYF